ncbi:helix-turn-helix transcriptional regulator [Streptomyces sp. NPDC007808]|uniref:helix-turn-helix transcriptional regulator n=1 Tax=Streptomyces sp. NPDC007808 TaxID=3364779 RepID=UPI0036C09897
MASRHSARPHDHARALAERVRALREARGWTRERLAKEAGIAVGTLARLEREGATSRARSARVARATPPPPQRHPPRPRRPRPNRPPAR